ncbi:uncharacterized protein BJX67DRAFT_375148 [Aspergillus lucknowensis]|uniref:Protein kinase domain-containing protein n=1 Tax=Aspergillus lucknowensis TaxID=176173 RepID=A0ABR4LDN1_9EURO
MSSSAVELTSYPEDQDYLVHGTPERSSRSQTLIYHTEGNLWWVKVTPIGTIASILDDAEKQPASKREQRKLFQSFVARIKYKLLPLLADTMTEVILEESMAGLEVEFDSGKSNATKSPNTSLRRQVPEDPLRTVYPSCDEFPSFKEINNKELTSAMGITNGVFWVNNNGMQYVLKIVNRPLYQPRDTDVIRKELENLDGVAVSTNPDMTSGRSKRPLVVAGILLRAYTRGSLQQVVAEHHVAKYSWTQWAVQIGTALICLHEAEKSHMDIKPLNVLDAKRNAVLIDISGIGGNSFSAIASQTRDDPEAKILNQVAVCLMESNCQTRMGLSTAISRLAGAGVHRGPSRGRGQEQTIGPKLLTR